MAIPFKLCHQNCWTNFRGSWLMVCTNEAWARHYTGDGVIWCVDVCGNLRLCTNSDILGQVRSSFAQTFRCLTERIEDQPSCGDSKCELLLVLRSVVRPLGPWFYHAGTLLSHVNWRCSWNELFAFQWWSAYFCVSWQLVGCYKFLCCPCELSSCRPSQGRAAWAARAL